MTLERWNKVIGINLTGSVPVRSRGSSGDFKTARCGSRKSLARRAKLSASAPCTKSFRGPGHVNYAASKGGVMLMMKSIAQEVAPYRIRVNSICPGAIRTPINMDAWDTPEAYHAL